jgi:hypothetical protein
MAVYFGKSLKVYQCFYGVFDLFNILHFSSSDQEIDSETFITKLVWLKLPQFFPI